MGRVQTESLPRVASEADLHALLETKNKVLSHDDATGTVEILAGVTNIVDHVGDVVEPGAYARTLKERNPKGCKSHDHKNPLAKAIKAEEWMPGDPRLPAKFHELGAGALYVKLQYNLDVAASADEYSMVKFMGDDGEWSIGYDCSGKKGKAMKNPKTGHRHIKDLTLYEVSSVLAGAAPHTRTLTVKSELEAGDELVRECKSLSSTYVLTNDDLAEYKALAASIEGKGYAKPDEDEEDDEDEAKAQRYNPRARDSDSDRVVQEGTPFARPASPTHALNNRPKGMDTETLRDDLRKAAEAFHNPDATGLGMAERAKLAKVMTRIDRAANRYPDDAALQDLARNADNVIEEVRQKYYEYDRATHQFVPKKKGELMSELEGKARGRARYNPHARDADADRIVQEGTPYARPAGPAQATHLGAVKPDRLSRDLAGLQRTVDKRNANARRMRARRDERFEEDDGSDPVDYDRFASQGTDKPADLSVGPKEHLARVRAILGADNPDIHVQMGRDGGTQVFSDTLGRDKRRLEAAGVPSRLVRGRGDSEDYLSIAPGVRVATNPSPSPEVRAENSRALINERNRDDYMNNNLSQGTDEPVDLPHPAAGTGKIGRGNDPYDPTMAHADDAMQDDADAVANILTPAEGGFADRDAAWRGTFEPHFLHNLRQGMGREDALNAARDLTDAYARDAAQDAADYTSHRGPRTDMTPSLFSGSAPKRYTDAKPHQTDSALGGTNLVARADARRDVNEFLRTHPGEGMADFYEANPMGSDTGNREYDDAYNAAVVDRDRELGSAFENAPEDDDVLRPIGGAGPTGAGPSDPLIFDEELGDVSGRVGEADLETLRYWGDALGMDSPEDPANDTEDYWRDQIMEYAEEDPSYVLDIIDPESDAALSRGGDRPADLRKAEPMPMSAEDVMTATNDAIDSMLAGEFADEAVVGWAEDVFADRAIMGVASYGEDGAPTVELWDVPITEWDAGAPVLGEPELVPIGGIGTEKNGVLELMSAAEVVAGAIAFKSALRRRRNLSFVDGPGRIEAKGRYVLEDGELKDIHTGSPTGDIPTGFSPIERMRERGRKRKRGHRPGLGDGVDVIGTEMMKAAAELLGEIQSSVVDDVERGDMEGKAGRVLSAANLERIKSALNVLNEVVEAASRSTEVGPLVTDIGDDVIEYRSLIDGVAVAEYKDLLDEVEGKRFGRDRGHVRRLLDAAIDADKDGKIYDGTPRERPAPRRTTESGLTLNAPRRGASDDDKPLKLNAPGANRPKPISSTDSNTATLERPNAGKPKPAATVDGGKLHNFVQTITHSDRDKAAKQEADEFVVRLRRDQEARHGGKPPEPAEIERVQKLLNGLEGQTLSPDAARHMLNIRDYMKDLERDQDWWARERPDGPTPENLSPEETAKLAKATQAQAAADISARAAEADAKRAARAGAKSDDELILESALAGLEAKALDPGELAEYLELTAGEEKRQFTQAERDDAADEGTAMPDGSYPIKNRSDLANAIQAYGRAKDKAAVKAHIIKRARALNAMSALPDGWA